MAAKVAELLTQEELGNHVKAAAEAAGYKDGFGVEGCDLNSTHWWAIYCRQSLDEQGDNNRLNDYLRTCAMEAKRLAVVVPREYVLFDLMTGEHLERPKMIFLRNLMAGRRIAGIIFPALDRLSREPLHQQIFELEAAHYRVQLQYADAPSGNDPGSQFARTILAHAAKLVKIANRKNNRGGNIGRVVNKNVPAGKTPYGYRYKAKYEDLGHLRRKLISASWEIDSLDPDGQLVYGSEAWIVNRVFQWVGTENRTLYWVAKKLNQMSLKPRYAKEWSPSLISSMVKKHCYTGHHVYNKATYVPNPQKPIGDATYAIKRTIRRLKPESEWAHFEVPPLISEKLWGLANRNLAERGRGKGKEGKQIDALVRGRIYCPSCDRLMSVYQDSDYRNLTYYICVSRSQGWKHKRCRVHSLRIDRIDNVVWDCLFALLK
jgi:site-specific DNA recombinase